MTYKDYKEYFSKEKNIRDNVKIKGGTVVDGKKFIEGAFATLDANSGKKTFIPYFLRLEEYFNLVKDLNAS